MAGILWKPSSERNGNLVILFPESPGKVVIKDRETGEVLATGTSSGPSNDFGDTIRFDQPGANFSNVIVELENGESFFIDEGGGRYTDITTVPAGVDPDAVTGKREDPSGGEGGPEGTGVPRVAPPIFIDPSLVQPFPITPAFIPQANFNFTDPLESTAETAEFNREQSELAFETGLSRAKRIQQEELASIIQFAEGVSQYQQQLVGQENQFNQQQRLQAAETAIPGVQDIFARQRERAETLAEGRLLTTAEDRAYELAAQSASAEGNIVRGFGDDSVVGRTTSEKLSAQQRLGLTQLGENFLSRSLQQAAGVLMDVPLKANISQRLPSQPNVPLASITNAQQAAETQLTTINPATALQATINQEQFQTNLEQQTNTFNATMQYNTDKFNSSQFYQALLGQIGLTMFNAQQQQTFLQNLFNAQAAEEQIAFEREQLDKLLADYERTRDRNQLIQGIAAIAGAGGKLPEYIWDELSDLGEWAVNGVAEALGIDPPFGDDTGSVNDAGNASVPSGEEDFGSGDEALPPEDDDVQDIDGDGDDDVTINPETGEAEVEEPFTPLPEEEEQFQTPIDGEDAERMLVYNPRTGNFRYRFFTQEMIDRLNFDPELRNYKSGADLHLTRRQLREMRGLI